MAKDAKKSRAAAAAAPKEDPGAAAKSAAKAAAPADAKKNDGKKNDVKNDTKKTDVKGAPSKPKAGNRSAAASQESAFLAAVRPAPRSVFFLVFVILCASLVGLHDQCKVPDGQKEDCGWKGVSPNMCKTGACFLKGGTGRVKTVIKVKVAAGQALGIKVDGVGKGPFAVGSLIGEGAAAAYNVLKADEPRDQLQVGDQVTKVGFSTGASMVASGTKVSKAAETIEVTVLRSRLPFWLRWAHSDKPGQPNMVEKVLSAPGSQYFGRTVSQMSLLGTATWFASGYPMASLPSYLSLATLVAVELSRCCHNENVPSGKPHCYKNQQAPVNEIIKKVAARAKGMFEMVSKDAPAWFRWAFIPKMPKL